MAPGCISRLWCVRQPPTLSNDGIVSPVLASVGATQPSTHPPGDEGVGDAAVIETALPHSPSTFGNADIPAPTSTQDSLPGSTGALTPLIEVQATGPHSLEGDMDAPIFARAEEVPLMSSSSFPAIRMDPARAKEHIDRIPRFRILVLGRANAGKTTILQRVCNTTEQPEIFNGEGKKVDATVVRCSLTRGLHNIEDELVFRSNPRFVFHDSRGFEAGSEEQFDLMKKFVLDRAKTTKLNKRIHAIWFCIPLTDSQRMVTAGEKKFFDECDTGHVPVILLATKADALELEAIEKLEDEGFNVDDVAGAEELEKEILNSYLARLKKWLGNARYAPHDYLPLTGMQHEGAECISLLTCTANALKEEGLQQLLISTQQSNLELCMRFAIMKTLKKCMSKGVDKIRPMGLALLLARWFPYKYYYYQPHLHGALEYPPHQELDGLGLAFEIDGPGLAFEAALHQLPDDTHFEDEPLDDDLLPSISHAAQSLTMPKLSSLMTCSMQYIAEHGIGSILVFECLYFFLQTKNSKDSLQKHLTLAVETYENSGAHAQVNKLILEAFQKYGEDVEMLCPVLVGIAQENQLSKMLTRNQ